MFRKWQLVCNCCAVKWSAAQTPLKHHLTVFAHKHICSYNHTSFTLEFSSCSSELILARGAAIRKEKNKKNMRRLRLHNSVSWREKTTVTMANNPRILSSYISGQLPRNSVSSGWQRFLADLFPVLVSNLALVFVVALSLSVFRRGVFLLSHRKTYLKFSLKKVLIIRLGSWHHDTSKWYNTRTLYRFKCLKSLHVKCRQKFVVSTL